MFVILTVGLIKCNLREISRSLEELRHAVAVHEASTVLVVRTDSLVFGHLLRTIEAGVEAVLALLVAVNLELHHADRGCQEDDRCK